MDTVRGFFGPSKVLGWEDLPVVEQLDDLVSDNYQGTWHNVEDNSDLDTSNDSYMSDEIEEE